MYSVKSKFSVQKWLCRAGWWLPSFMKLDRSLTCSKEADWLLINVFSPVRGIFWEPPSHNSPLQDQESSRGGHIMIESDRELSAMVQELWDNDVNRLTPGRDYRISLQVCNTTGGSCGDSVGFIGFSPRCRAKPKGQPSPTTTTTTGRGLLCLRLSMRTFSRRRRFWVSAQRRDVWHLPPRQLPPRGFSIHP